MVKTVQNSPCIQKKRQIEPFRASRESFVPEVGPCGSCWESFVPHMRWEGACWESFVPHMRCEGVCWESFVPEVGPCGSCWARFVSPWHLPRVQLPGFRHPPVPHPGPPAPAARSTLVAVGVLRHAKPSGGVSPACRASNVAIPPDWWRRGRGSRRCGRQSADPLGENSQITTVVAEWVCVLGATMSGMVCWSHVNPLLRAVTRDTARKPAIECVGGAAHVRISGFTCTSKGLGHYLSGYRAQRSVSIRQAMGLSCAGVTSVFDRY